MCNRRNRLHLNGIHLLQRVIKNSRSVNGLEPEVFVIEMAHEQTLGGEGVRLNIDIGAGDRPQKARLSDIGVATDQEGPGIGIDGGQTTEMLSHLLEVDQRVFETFADGCHAAQGRALELFALK